MAQLTRCIECSHRISTQAAFCPRCRASSPHGHTCGVCARRDKAVALEQVVASDRNIRFLHPACREHVNRRIEYSCAACHMHITEPSCPNCGHFHQVRECYFCGQTVVQDLAYGVTDGNPRSWESETRIVHGACYASRRKDLTFNWGPRSTTSTPSSQAVLIFLIGVGPIVLWFLWVK